MTSTEKDDLRKLVNASGFPFQLRVGEEVTNTSSKHHKTVIAREHKWVDASTGNEGFIDLILTTGTRGKMVVECKRVIDATWIFLAPSGATPTTRANVLWSCKFPDDRQVAAWDELNLYPESLQSSFCIVRGQGEKDSPMLERVSSILLRSTECLAAEEQNYARNPGSAGVRFYFPVIITTAKLKVCRYTLSKIDLSSGQLSEAEFEDVPFIRFTKSLSTRLQSSRLPTKLQESVREDQRTVFVASTDSLSTILLGEWEFDKPAWVDEAWPWDLQVWHQAK